MVALLAQMRLVLNRRIGTLHDRSGDDDGIVVEDGADIVETLQGVGGLVVLEEVHDGKARLL